MTKSSKTDIERAAKWNREHPEQRREIVNALESGFAFSQRLTSKSYHAKLRSKSRRVALKYALLVDDYLMKGHGLTIAEEQQLETLAKKLFNETPQIRRQKVT